MKVEKGRLDPCMLYTKSELMRIFRKGYDNIKEMVEDGTIPHVTVKGTQRFCGWQVWMALDRMAARENNLPANVIQASPLLFANRARKETRALPAEKVE